MEYITMIMSGLALLAATVSLFLILHEKKRNQKRNADLVNLINAEAKALRKENDWGIELVTTKVDNLSTKVDKLEAGIVPDYQEALAAKNSVDEFNRGLSAIMGYDPMEVARKAREERLYSGEVK